MSLRTSETYVVATVRVRSTGFELRMKQPKSLEPNQFAFKVTLQIKEEDWFKRVIPINLKVGPGYVTEQVICVKCGQNETWGKTESGKKK